MGSHINKRSQKIKVLGYTFSKQQNCPKGKLFNIAVMGHALTEHTERKAEVYSSIDTYRNLLDLAPKRCPFIIETRIISRVKKTLGNSRQIRCRRMKQEK